jgi:DNA-binding response OmpR family regulator
MSEPKFIALLIDVAAELGAFVERAQQELDEDQYRVLESTAYKALASLEHGTAQLVYLDDQYHRMTGRQIRRRPKPPGILVPFRKPSNLPGRRR